MKAGERSPARPRSASIASEGSEGGFLIWVRAFDGALAPQLAFDNDGGRPYLDRGIRSALACWTPLTAREAVLPLDELARRYPPGLGHMLVDGEHLPASTVGSSP